MRAVAASLTRSLPLRLPHRRLLSQKSFIQRDHVPGEAAARANSEKMLEERRVELCVRFPAPSPAFPALTGAAPARRKSDFVAHQEKTASIRGVMREKTLTLHAPPPRLYSAKRVRGGESNPLPPARPQLGLTRRSSRGATGVQLPIFGGE